MARDAIHTRRGGAGPRARAGSGRRGPGRDSRLAAARRDGAAPPWKLPGRLADVAFLKRALFSVATPAGRFDGARSGGNAIGRPATAWSRVVCLDLDGVDDAPALRDRVAGDERCAFAVVSVSGNGVFCGFVVDRDPADASEWPRIVRYVARQVAAGGSFVFGQIDAAAASTTRLRILPHDPHLHRRVDPVVVRLPDELTLRELDADAPVLNGKPRRRIGTREAGGAPPPPAPRFEREAAEAHRRAMQAETLARVKALRVSAVGSGDGRPMQAVVPVAPLPDDAGSGRGAVSPAVARLRALRTRCTR